MGHLYHSYVSLPEGTSTGDFLWGNLRKVVDLSVRTKPTELHIHAEHDPHGAGQGGGTDHGAPNQAQLTDAVDRKPIGEGLDPDFSWEKLGGKAGKAGRIRIRSSKWLLTTGFSAITKKMKLEKRMAHWTARGWRRKTNQDSIYIYVYIHTYIA